MVIFIVVLIFFFVFFEGWIVEKDIKIVGKFSGVI